MAMAAASINKSLFVRLIKASHARAVVPQRNGFFSSKKTGSEEVQELQVSAKRITDQEGSFTTKYNLGMLKSRVSLDTKVGYKPPANVRGTIQELVIPHVGEKHWDTASLKDPTIKYRVMSRLIKEFKHDCPNSILSEIKTVSDAIEYFETEVHETSTFEDMSKLDLPKNLHMQLEYMRFDPETDTMFNGRTAFPGSDTYVTSIKYKRKYKNIKTTKEKPGFINYYYGY